MISDVRTAARPLLLAAALSGAALSLSACAPLIVGGAAATTALVVTDRRTSGIQLEDQNMAFKAQSQISQKLGETARVNAMAYGGRHVEVEGDRLGFNLHAYAWPKSRWLQATRLGPSWGHVPESRRGHRARAWPGPPCLHHGLWRPPTRG